MLLGAVPNSLFEPFVEGNVLQIVLIAFMVSVCVIMLDKRTANLASATLTRIIRRIIIIGFNYSEDNIVFH